MRWSAVYKAMTATFLSLPVEIIEKVSSYLDPLSLWSLCQTCRNFDHVLTNDQVWRLSLTRDFGFEVEKNVSARCYFDAVVRPRISLLGTWLMEFRSCVHVLFVYPERAEEQNRIVGMEILFERERRSEEEHAPEYDRQVKGMKVMRIDLAMNFVDTPHSPIETTCPPSFEAGESVSKASNTDRPSASAKDEIKASAKDEIEVSAKDEIEVSAKDEIEASAKDEIEASAKDEIRVSAAARVEASAPAETTSLKSSCSAVEGPCILGLDQYPSINCKGTTRLEQISDEEFRFQCLDSKTHDKSYNDFDFSCYTSSYEKFHETYEYMHRNRWWHYNYLRWLEHEFSCTAKRIQSNVNDFEPSTLSKFLPASGFFVSSGPVHGAEMMLLRYQTIDNGKRVLVGINVSGTRNPSNSNFAFRASLDQLLRPTAEEQLRFEDLKKLKPVTSGDIDYSPAPFVQPGEIETLPRGINLPNDCVCRFPAVVPTGVGENEEPVFTDAHLVVFNQDQLALICFDCQSLFFLERRDFATRRWANRSCYWKPIHSTDDEDDW